MATRQDLQLVEGGVVDPGGAERGRSVGRPADHLAVAADELRVAVDLETHRLDAGDALDRLRQARVDLLALAGEVGRRRVGLLGSHDGRGLAVDLVVEAVEGGVDGVGEDKGAGHEGNAERHREGRHRVADPVRCDLAQRDPEHSGRPSGAASGGDGLRPPDSSAELGDGVEDPLGARLLEA